MRVKHPFLLIIHLTVTYLVFGCGNGASANEPLGAAQIQQAQDPKQRGAPGGKWEKLVMHPFHDAQGAVIVEMPFPVAWKVMSNHKVGEPTIVGSNGVKVIDFPGKFFTYTRDPRLQQTYRAAGQQLRAMPSVEQIVQQDFVPWAAGQGLKFVRQYEIPEISKIDKWHNDQLFKAVPMQIKIQAIGTDWVTAKGEQYFIVTHLSASDSGLMQNWSYYSNGIQAEKSHFETAKKQLIFGLANARYNLQQIMAYNQMEAQKAGQSWAAHNERMARNQANFEASQRDFVNRSTAAHDALINSWRERNAASDKAHERFVDTITERTKVVNPSSGQLYKVEAGYNHYWMNSDGKYISTDKQDYDPNLDETINNQKWQELKKTE